MIPFSRRAVPARLVLPLAALCCILFQIPCAHASGTATEPGIDVDFRLAPADARIVEGNRELAGRPGSNGARVIRLSPGTHELWVLAGGHVAASLVLAVAGPGQTVEAKLERTGGSLRLQAIVPVEPRPKSVEYTPDGRFLVSAPLSGGRLDVLDPDTGRRVTYAQPPAPWAAMQGFVEMAFPHGRRELWASQMYADRIHVFSLDDFSWLRSFPSGGSFPKVLLAHPDGRVFVSHWLSMTVCALDPADGRVLGTMRTRGTPRGMALSPDGSRLYVADFGGGTIEEFDTGSYARTRTLFDGSGGLPAGGNKRHLAVDPVARRLYASDMGRGSVFAVDMDGWTLLAEIPVGHKTNTIKLSPDGSTLYVSTRGPNNPVDYERKGPAFGELLAIDTATLRIAQRRWGGNQPTGLAVSPDGRQVAFSDFLDHRVELYRLLP